MLDALDSLPEIHIEVLQLWTGTVVEVLSHVERGRKFLYADGHIIEHPSDGTSSLTIFMTTDTARDLHVHTPLIQLRASESTIVFRLAEPHESVPAVLLGKGII